MVEGRLRDGGSEASGCWKVGLGMVEGRLRDGRRSA